MLAKVGFVRVSKRLKPDFIQSWASFEHPEFIRLDVPLAPFMIESGIRLIAMMPFGQGRLLAKHKSAAAPTFGPGDNRIGNPEFQKDSLQAVEPKLLKLQQRFGPEPADLIALWCHLSQRPRVKLSLARCLREMVGAYPGRHILIPIDNYDCFK